MPTIHPNTSYTFGFKNATAQPYMSRSLQVEWATDFMQRSIGVRSGLTGSTESVELDHPPRVGHTYENIEVSWERKWLLGGCI